MYRQVVEELEQQSRYPLEVLLLVYPELYVEQHKKVESIILVQYGLVLLVDLLQYSYLGVLDS